MSDIYTALNNLIQIFSDYLQTYDLSVINIATVKSLIITDSIVFPSTYIWNSIINQASTLLGTNHFVKSEFSGNITQTNGSNQFLDSQIGNITQPTGIITQNGTNWNLLKKTQITELEVLNSLVLPSNITIAGSTYTNDLILNNATIQQTNTTGINTFSATDFYNGDVRLNNNFTMIGGALTIATLKNLVVQGTSTLGLITGTTITDIYNKILDKANLFNPSFPNNIYLSSGTGTTKGNLFWQDSTNFMRMFSSGSAGFLDIYGAFQIRRVTATGANAVNALTIASNGNTTLSGTLTVPNILMSGNINNVTSTQINYLNGVTSPIQTQLNTIVTNVSSNTTSINSLRTDVSSNTTSINSLRTDVSSNTTSINSLITDVSSNTINITNNTSAIYTLQNTPSVQSINVTATSIASGENAYVTNTGTATNQLLNIHCPRGADGSNGSKGDKGNTGNTGPQGETGGDGGGAVAGGIAGGIAGTASGSVAGGIAGSAVATSICSAQLAVIEPQISALTTTTAGLQTQINTLGDGMLQIDNDIIQLKAKTSNISAVGTTTFISGTVETGNIVNSGTLYSAGDATIVGSVKASNFTGGLLPTKINGTSISIGTNEVLFNNVTIGSATTITTIHGIVNYSNPFNNFFSQF